MNSLYGLPSAAGCVLAIAASVLVYRRRPGSAGRLIAAGSLTAGWWCLGQFLWVPIQDPEGRVWLAKLQYFGITTTPVLWFLGASAYVGSRRWLRPGRMAWLWLIPSLTFALALTNESHQLIWNSFEPVPGLPRALVTYGAWFPVHAAYSYTLVLAGTAIIAVRLVAAPLYRSQLAFILLGPACVLLGNILHLGARSRLPIDPTPSAFALAFLLLAWSVARHGSFGVAPLARARTLESLREGVVVLDESYRVIDANRSALDFLCREPSPLGMPLSRALPEAPLPTTPGVSEVSLSDGRRLEVEVTMVEGPDGIREGRVVLLRDVTDVREAQDRLARARQELERLNRDLDAMAHIDALTGLANRRRFQKALDEECARARRYNRELSVLLFDLDHFKGVNDARGHPVGDRVLEAVGRVLSSALRPGDVAARQGGEEFAVLLPDAGPSEAAAIANRLRDELTGLDHSDDNGERFKVTVSGGVATLRRDESPAQLIARADHGLYFIKNTGRDGMAREAGDHFERVSG